jgi:hypothetical protein
LNGASFENPVNVHRRKGSRIEPLIGAIKRVVADNDVISIRCYTFADYPFGLIRAEVAPSDGPSEGSRVDRLVRYASCRVPIWYIVTLFAIPRLVH